MPLTLSPPLVLADAGGDAAVVAGMASTIPAASAPVTFDFMVSPGITGTAHDRGAAHPSSPRKHWPGYWPAGGVDPWPASGYHMALCSPGGVSQLRPGVRYACLPHAEGPFSIRERASERRSPVLAAAPAHHLDPGRTGTVDQPHPARLDELYGRFYRSAPYPLLGASTITLCGSCAVSTGDYSSSARTRREAPAIAEVHDAAPQWLPSRKPETQTGNLTQKNSVELRD